MHTPKPSSRTMASRLVQGLMSLGERSMGQAPEEVAPQPSHLSAPQLLVPQLQNMLMWEALLSNICIHQHMAAAYGTRQEGPASGPEHHGLNSSHGIAPATAEHPQGPCSHTSVTGHVLFRGLRIRMGLHTGVHHASDVSENKASGRVVYSGEALVMAKAVSDASHGGLVLVSSTTLARLQHITLCSAWLCGPHSTPLVIPMGTHVLKDTAQPAQLYAVTSMRHLARLALAGSPAPPPPPSPRDDCTADITAGQTTVSNGVATTSCSMNRPEPLGCSAAGGLSSGPQHPLRPLRSLKLLAPCVLHAPVGLVNVVAVKVAGTSA